MRCSSGTMQLMSQPRESDRDLGGLDWSIPFVLWGSVAQAALGATYLVALAVGSFGGTLVYPPPDWLQTVAALATLGEGPLLVIVIAGLGASAGSNKRALAVIAVCFTSLFALSVSINRFSQLGVIRQSAGHGSPRPESIGFCRTVRTRSCSGWSTSGGDGFWDWE